MNVRNIVLRACVALLAAAAGCGKETDAGKQAAPAAQASRPGTLLPPLGEGARVVLEAEAGTVVSPMVVVPFEPYRHPRLGVQVASGGECVSIPDGVNPKDAKETALEGRVTLEFTVPKDGKYYIYPRAWWLDQCGNSFGMLIDGRNPTARPESTAALRPLIVGGDTTLEVWHWIKLMPDDVKSNAPRAFTLTRGRHTVTFTNREDGPKLDQIYITDDPDDRPAGIVKMTK